MRIAISACLVCLVLAGFVAAQQSGRLGTPPVDTPPLDAAPPPPEETLPEPARPQPPVPQPARTEPAPTNLPGSNPSPADPFGAEPTPNELFPPDTSSVRPSVQPPSAVAVEPRRSNAGNPLPADFGDTRNNTFLGSEDLLRGPTPAVGFIDPNTGRVSGAYVGGSTNSVFSQRTDGRENAANARVTRATNVLRTVTPDKRAQAEQELQAALEELFEIRTASREAQIAALQRRLEILRQQLKERTAKKAGIVRLRVQTLVNEANGLGF